MDGKNRFFDVARVVTTLLAMSCLALAAQAEGTAEKEIARILSQGSLKDQPNPVVLELLLADGIHHLSADQQAKAKQQVIDGLRDRALVTTSDSMNAMMGSMKEVVKAQFKPKNILKSTFGLGGGKDSEANQIMGEAIVGPWVRGLAAAGTLADAGYIKDAAGFYQRCLAEPLLAPAGSSESSGGGFGEWVQARCERELVGRGAAVAGPIFSQLTQGNSGSSAPQSEASVPVARAAGLSGFNALLEAGMLDVEQTKAVADAALAVLKEPKKELDNALASAAANVLGNTGLPEARNALLNLADQAKSGRFSLGGKSDLEGAARSAQLALARGFDHRPSIDLLTNELLGGKGGKGGNPFEAFEALLDAGQPAAMGWAKDQFELLKTQDPKTWAEPLIERLGMEGGPLSLETLHDAEPVTVEPDDYVQAKLAISLFENGERERLPVLAAAIERDSWNLGGSALQQGSRLLKPLAKVAARHVLGLPIPQGPSDRMLVDFAIGAAERYDRQQDAEATAVRKMRLRVATALSTWDDPRAVPLINRLLTVGDESVRIGAARALLGQTSPDVVPDLIAALDLEYGSDEDEPRAPEIQAALLLHAGRIFGAATEVQTTLGNFDQFEYDSVRFVAASMAAVTHVHFEEKR